MANQEHLDILKQGVEAWNAWRNEHPEVQPDLHGANLHDANLRGADLSGAHLTDANLSYADLTFTNLIYANLDGAHLIDANLIDANLAGAYLSYANLSDANLTDANLKGTDLTNAKLTSAILHLAILSYANLSYANLRDARLNGAKLTGAHLKGTNLKGANLNGADLTNANLKGAFVGSTSFADVDLSEVRGLDAVQHVSPSTIGIDTIYRSHGKIPEAFLRGAGVPENFITYMKSLTGNAFDFYSCFISYSTKDQDFADRLRADLQARGVRCWFAPHDIQAGRKLHEQIDEAIKIYDKLLLILSDASMNSNWVKTEIANARAKEKKRKRQMLFPDQRGDVRSDQEVETVRRRHRD
jgi:uncharacterized protein YjbI with pentapeptide repeats